MPVRGDAREGPGQAPSDGPDTVELMRLFIDTVRDYAIFALDRNGHVLTWNAGAERLKGYRQDEIVGRHFSTFYPDEDVARGKPDRELRIASEYGRFEDEGWRIRRDGSRFWANVIITAIREPDTNRVVGFGKVTRDLTERRLAEQELRLSEERFRLLVEGVEDYAIILVDPVGRIQSWNLGAERILGYRAQEIVGSHIRTFYTKEDDAAGGPETELRVAREVGKYEEENWRVRKDGSRFWANVIVTALHDKKTGMLVGYSKVTRDLTARRRAEEELQRAYRDMESFSYTVSHDLRAPLRAIDALAGFTLRDEKNLTEEGRENLRAIHASAERATQLVEGLLAFGRAAAGDLRRQRVDVVAVVREVEPALRARYAHPVDLVLPAEPVHIEGDPPLVRAVVENILSNAWKFTQKTPEPRVEVSAEEEPGLLILSIADNGAGFEPHRVAELFEPFRRLHGEKEYAGTGIGLATVRRIVERHGGRVWAEGRPREGATFHVAWPRPE